MSNGLRYASVHHMPEHMRQKAMRAMSTQDVRKHPSGTKPRSDSEFEIQVEFIERIKQLAAEDPRYALAERRTYHIPNGGGRSKREGGRLKASGVKKGVPDIKVSLPAGGYVGMYIEMKSPTGQVSDEQRNWISESRALGYAVKVCRSADEAFGAWKEYVDASF